jgi:hypothetical protein
LTHDRSSHSALALRVSICSLSLFAFASCSAEPSDPGTGTGGTSTAGTAPVAGTSTAGGSGGTGGTATGGGGGTTPYVSPIVLDCPWEDTLRKSCAITACHAAPRGAVMAMADLILTPDEGLIRRIKDVPGTLGDLNCSADPSLFVECTTPPASCTPLVGMKLVNSQAPEESLMLKKLGASGCGEVMPAPPGNATMTGWNDDRKACMDRFVRAVAALPPQ